MRQEYKESIEDIVKGFLGWRMWGRLGWQETKRRYRRTVIGPFWTTLSLGIFILALGFVWANLWKQDPKVYLPFLCSGMLVWVLVSSIVNEGCAVFFGAENLLKQIRFPYFILVFSVVWRNLIVFFHNLIIFLLVGIFAGVKITWASLLVFPGLLIIFINGLWVCTIFGLLCARFRDIQQVISSILQVSMFVTPIFWSAQQLGERFSIVVNLNVLYHFLDIVRSPLLGKGPSYMSWSVTLGLTVFGWAATIMLYSRFRRRLPYWV